MVAADFERFRSLFLSTMSSSNTLLDSVLRYVAGRSGKQIRPLMVLLAAKMCHGISDKTVQTAVALELLHTASLMHDDVVDGSDLRRGMPSVNSRFGNKAAVLTGDWMLAKAIELTAAVNNRKILNVVANIGQELASGELMQLHADNSMWIDEERYISIIKHKTASLFAACMEAGAYSSGGTERQAKALAAFGRELGIIFQLKDDMLDYSEQDIGKPTMSDIADGKVTVPLLVSLRRAPENEAAEIMKLAENMPQEDREQALQTIQSFVLRYDGIGYTAKLMDKHKQLALEALDIFHLTPAKSALVQLLQYTIIRSY